MSDAKLGPGAVGGGRQRLVEATAALLARQGYEATGVKEITTAASAPMGSFYFHFPGGKQELTVAALGFGADAVAESLRRTLESTEPVEEALPAFVLRLARSLPESDWADGCPVATTALESVVRAPALRAAAAQAFAAWKDVVHARLVGAGMAEERAAELASSAIALIEGAEMLARVEADPAPLLHAASTLRSLTALAMAESGPQVPAR